MAKGTKKNHRAKTRQAALAKKKAKSNILPGKKPTKAEQKIRISRQRLAALGLLRRSMTGLKENRNNLQKALLGDMTGYKS